jgi:hypothetical protein
VVLGEEKVIWSMGPTVDIQIALTNSFDARRGMAPDKDPHTEHEDPEGYAVAEQIQRNLAIQDTEDIEIQVV